MCAFAAGHAFAFVALLVCPVSSASARELSDAAAAALVGAGSLAGGVVGVEAGAGLGLALFADTAELGPLVGLVGGGILGGVGGELAGAALAAHGVHRRTGPAVIGGLVGLGVGSAVLVSAARSGNSGLALPGVITLGTGIPLGAAIGTAATAPAPPERAGSPGKSADGASFRGVAWRVRF